MHAYIEELAHKWDKIGLLEERHRVEQIVYEYELEIDHILCENEKRKWWQAIADWKELIAFIDHMRVNINLLIK